MEYSLRAMELWFQHSPGSLLLEHERQALANWFANNAGVHCLQIGGPSDLRLIQAAHFPHKAYIGVQPTSASSGSCIQSDLTALPVLPNSIDTAVLVHALEFAASPKTLLKETYRILAPEGQLILLAFNPFSWWGVQRFAHEKRGFPWSAKCYARAKIKHWLQKSGYSIITSKTLCFRPIFADERRYRRWSFIEKLGSRCLPGLGAVIFIIARKRQVGMTAIKADWKRSSVKVGRRVVEPTTYR